MKINVSFSIDTNKFKKEDLLSIINDFQWDNACDDFDDLTEVPEEIILMAIEQSVYHCLLGYYNIDKFKINEEN